MDIPWTEVKVDKAGIFPETGNPHPAVWLHQVEGEFSLPIQVGQTEALAISPKTSALRSTVMLMDDVVVFWNCCQCPLPVRSRLPSPFEAVWPRKDLDLTI